MPGAPSGMSRKTLEQIFRRLEKRYGPTHWWPGDSPFEIAVGAILTQNTAWGNVERAITNLKCAGLLGPAAIARCPEPSLHEALRPSGYFRIKTRRLRAFCEFLLQRYGGDMARLAARPLDELRPELLAVEGIGPETADDILLYACDKPVFVVDAYTRRILSRHGLCSPQERYETLQALFERSLPADVRLFKEYHGLLVYTGKDYCRRRPRCEECPLRPMLRGGAPLLGECPGLPGR